MSNLDKQDGSNGGNEGGGNKVTNLASGAIRTLAALLERTKLLQGLGLQFGGDRDLYTVFGYNKTPTYVNYLQRFSRQDIAARVVEAPSAATWKRPPTIKGDSNFDTRWEKLIKDTRLWSNIERADKLAGLGRYSILFMGFDDGAQAKMPVRKSTGRKLLYVQPLGESSVTISKFEASTSSPRFGLPTEYKITISDPESRSNSIQASANSEATASTVEITAHHTRVVHILENSLEDKIYGIPRLARVYNLLDDLLKVCGGSAETFWLTANRGLHADIDKDMELDTTDAADLSTMIDDYQHQLRRVIRTRGVKLSSLGSDVPDPTGTFQMLISLLSGATGIPQRILLGSEAGQLASEQDRANWAERIDERRMAFAEPMILMPVLDNLIGVGVLPSVNYTIDWPEAFIMSPLERAQEMAQKARTVTNLARQTKEPMQITSREEARSILGLEGNLAPSDIVTPPAPPTSTPPTQPQQGQTTSTK